MHRLTYLAVEDRRSERAAYFIIGSHLPIDRLHIGYVEAARRLVSHQMIPNVFCDTDYRERELQPAVIEDRLAERTPLTKIKSRHTLVDDRYAGCMRGIRISEIAAQQQRNTDGGEVSRPDLVKAGQRIFWR